MQMTIVTYHTVTEADFASALKSGSLAVLATPRMIAWMEEACTMAIDLADGLTTVGTWCEISHVKASKEGARIRTEAIMVSNDGRRMEFEVRAFDEKGLIGKGRMQRATVNVEKFLSRL